MATNRVPEEPQQDELPMTPMIDVIFQLVIFFMCSGHFKQIEGKLQTYLPKGPGTAPTPSDEVNPEVRIRLVTSQETVVAYLEGRRLADFSAAPGRLEGISPKWDRIGQEAAQIWRPMVSRNPFAALKIDATPKVPFQYVVSTLDACRRFGVQNVEFVASGRLHEQLQGGGR